MINDGLVEEIKALLDKGITKEHQCMQAIGYKEFTQVPKEEVRELIKKNTRNYAKRQMTFFKNQFENITELAECIEKETERARKYSNLFHNCERLLNLYREKMQQGYKYRVFNYQYSWFLYRNNMIVKFAIICY
jgi:tRNA A37 N6-isopentenylltransferase MiaA